MQSADYLGQFIVLLPGYKKVPKQDVYLKTKKNFLWKSNHVLFPLFKAKYIGKFFFKGHVLFRKVSKFSCNVLRLISLLTPPCHIY